MVDNCYYCFRVLYVYRLKQLSAVVIYFLVALIANKGLPFSVHLNLYKW